MRKKSILLWIVLMGITAGCSSPGQPSEAEIKSARAADPAMRNIDKAKTVANDASDRTDDPSLH